MLFLSRRLPAHGKGIEVGPVLFGEFGNGFADAVEPCAPKLFHPPASKRRT
jgi:hypothetical protein